MASGSGDDPITAPTRQGQLIDQINNVRIPITATTIIGSDPGQDREAALGIAATVTVNDPEVNAVHLRIAFDGPSTTVDSVAGSTTWFQAREGEMAELADGPVVLRHGDVLRIGSQRFIYQLPDPGSS